MKFLFYLSKKYSYSIIKPIVEYLEKSTNDEISFYVFHWIINEFPEKWLKYEIFETIEDVIDYKPDFVIAPGNFVDYRIPGIKAQIFHGLGVEKKSHFVIRPFFDVYLTSGPFVTERFKRLQRKYGFFLVKETGWAKIDHIIKYPTRGLKKKLDIPKYENIILYAPTCSEKMHSADELFPIIPDIIKDNEFWLIKFHELMKKNIIREFRKNKPENCKIIEDTDITPYLHISNILISDTSSVLYEFMILDKPVITFRTISRFDKGINITESDQLRNAIDRTLEKPDNLHYNRVINLNEVCPYKDGKTSERIINTLKGIQLEDYHSKKDKPLNLYRKFKVLKKVRG